MKALSGSLGTLTLLLTFGCTAPDTSQPPTSPTQGTRHAALVVTHGDGSSRSVEVGFDAESIDGKELFERSGLGFTAKYFTRPGGWALCSVDGEGCSYPDERCLCQSSYWSQWRWDGEAAEWVSLSEGILGRTVRDGDAWGVVWGDGSAPPNLPPP